MLYHDHGLGTDFMSYDRYFTPQHQCRGRSYLQLANELIHAVTPSP